MDSGSARGDGGNIDVIVGDFSATPVGSGRNDGGVQKTLQLLFKGIDIWTKRGNPVGIERFLDVALLGAGWRHVGEAKMYAMINSHISIAKCKNTNFILYYTNIKRI